MVLLIKSEIYLVREMMAPSMLNKQVGEASINPWLEEWASNSLP